MRWSGLDAVLTWALIGSAAEAHRHVCFMLPVTDSVNESVTLGSSDPSHHRPLQYLRRLYFSMTGSIYDHILQELLGQTC
jgi:hypothetical protein